MLPPDTFAQRTPAGFGVGVGSAWPAARVSRATFCLARFRAALLFPCVEVCVELEELGADAFAFAFANAFFASTNSLRAQVSYSGVCLGGGGGASWHSCVEGCMVKKERKKLLRTQWLRTQRRKVLKKVTGKNLDVSHLLVWCSRNLRAPIAIEHGTHEPHVTCDM